LIELVEPDEEHHFHQPCDRCGGRGHGPSPPTGHGWWWDERELSLFHSLEAAKAPDSWDGPGWDESDDVPCPFCGGTGLIEGGDEAANEPEEIAF